MFLFRQLEHIDFLPDFRSSLHTWAASRDAWIIIRGWKFRCIIFTRHFESVGGISLGHADDRARTLTMSRFICANVSSSSSTLNRFIKTQTEWEQVFLSALWLGVHVQCTVLPTVTRNLFPSCEMDTSITIKWRKNKWNLNWTLRYWIWGNWFCSMKKCWIVISLKEIATCIQTNVIWDVQV